MLCKTLEFFQEFLSFKTGLLLVSSGCSLGAISDSVSPLPHALPAHITCSGEMGPCCTAQWHRAGTWGQPALKLSPEVIDFLVILEPTQFSHLTLGYSFKTDAAHKGMQVSAGWHQHKAWAWEGRKSREKTLTDCSPFPVLLCHLRVKLSLGSRENVVVFEGFSCYPSVINCQHIKLIFPKLSLFCLQYYWRVISVSFILAHCIFILFFSPNPVEKVE